LFVYILILFLCLPLIELYFLIQSSAVIGLGNTILIVLFTGVLGAAIARNQGLKKYLEIQKDLNRGIMPAENMIDGVMIFAAGVVLLTPGFITDAIGFFILWPTGRNLVKNYFKNRFTAQRTSDGKIIRYFRQDDI